MSIRFGILSAVSGIALTASTTQMAQALPVGDGQFNAQITQSGPRATFEGVDFSAIVALSNCSGSLVRFNSSQATDKAMVLSNGHCYENGFLDPGEVLVNRASTRTFSLLSADGSSTLGTLRARKVMYATMTDTDVTLYQLTQTYADIERAYRVNALTLSDVQPAVDTAIVIASGYWRRIYSCSIDSTVYSLREDQWTFKDSIRYSKPGCETIGGTSGSPIIDATTHEVIGINNTGNEDGERCTMNNPCEVDENGSVIVRKSASYGQQTYHFYGCLDEANQIDLDRASCMLPKPALLN